MSGENILEKPSCFFWKTPEKAMFLQMHSCLLSSENTYYDPTLGSSPDYAENDFGDWPRQMHKGFSDLFVLKRLNYLLTHHRLTPPVSSWRHSPLDRVPYSCGVYVCQASSHSAIPLHFVQEVLATFGK